MKTVQLIFWPLMIVIVLSLPSAWSQDEMTTVDNSVFDNPQRPPSVFVHDEHNENAGIDDCAQCHHVYKDGELMEGESSEDERCSDCHTLAASDDQPSLIKAFHTNCKGCHQEEKKGAILCGECHRK